MSSSIRLLCAVSILGLSGCAVTLKSPSNTCLTGGAPIISNSMQIASGQSDPHETLSFAGLRTGNGRWGVIKDIAGTTHQMRKAFRENRKCLVKHDTVAFLAQIFLLVEKFFMSFEGKGGAPDAATGELTQADLDARLDRLDLPADIRTGLSEAFQAIRAPQPGEDSILTGLKKIRETLRTYMAAPGDCVVPAS